MSCALCHSTLMSNNTGRFASNGAPILSSISSVRIYLVRLLVLRTICTVLYIYYWSRHCKTRIFLAELFGTLHKYRTKNSLLNTIHVFHFIYLISHALFTWITKYHSHTTKHYANYSSAVLTFAHVFYVLFPRIDYRIETSKLVRKGRIVTELSKMANISAAEKNDERRKRVSVSCWI